MAFCFSVCGLEMKIVIYSLIDKSFHMVQPFLPPLIFPIPIRIMKLALYRLWILQFLQYFSLESHRKVQKKTKCHFSYILFYPLSSTPPVLTIHFPGHRKENDTSILIHFLPRYLVTCNITFIVYTHWQRISFDNAAKICIF